MLHLHPCTYLCKWEKSVTVWHTRFFLVLNITEILPSQLNEGWGYSLSGFSWTCLCSLAYIFLSIGFHFWWNLQTLAINLGCVATEQPQRKCYCTCTEGILICCAHADHLFALNAVGQVFPGCNKCTGCSWCRACTQVSAWKFWQLYSRLTEKTIFIFKIKDSFHGSF